MLPQISIESVENVAIIGVQETFELIPSNKESVHTDTTTRPRRKQTATFIRKKQQIPAEQTSRVFWIRRQSKHRKSSSDKSRRGEIPESLPRTRASSEKDSEGSKDEHETESIILKRDRTQNDEDNDSNNDDDHSRDYGRQQRAVFDPMDEVDSRADGFESLDDYGCRYENNSIEASCASWTTFDSTTDETSLVSLMEHLLWMECAYFDLFDDTGNGRTKSAGLFENRARWQRSRDDDENDQDNSVADHQDWESRRKVRFADEETDQHDDDDDDDNSNNDQYHQSARYNNKDDDKRQALRRQKVKSLSSSGSRSTSTSTRQRGLKQRRRSLDWSRRQRVRSKRSLVDLPPM